VATRQLVRPQQPHLEPGQQGLLIRGGQSKSRAHAPKLEKSAGRCSEKSDYLLILQDIIDHHDRALNSGTREGTETVQLYLRRLVGSVTTPVKQLRGFQRVHLIPGEKKLVEFVLKPDDLALFNRQMRWEVEPGEIEIMVGSSSRTIHLRSRLSVRAE
jgi:hypothetical protein